MKAGEHVAVITGGASGIGLALAEICLQRGLHVVLADIAVTALCDKVEQLSNHYDKGEVLGVVCDVSKPESLWHLAKQTKDYFGRVDWLFNNAGISGHLAPIWELTPEHIRKVMDVNLYGVIYGAQAFMPLMSSQKHRSRIINMSSFYGLCSSSQLAPYAMSKHAILALSESLHFDLRRLNKPIDVSVVCPSFINTHLLTNSSPLHADKFHQLLTDLISSARSPIDVAEQIIKQIEKGIFYILPDKEVKNYCEQRNNSIINQNEPYPHNLEKIIASLSQRALLEP